jgi:hypothetical protein
MADSFPIMATCRLAAEVRRLHLFKAGFEVEFKWHSAYYSVDRTLPRVGQGLTLYAAAAAGRAAIRLTDYL